MSSVDADFSPSNEQERKTTSSKLHQEAQKESEESSKRKRSLLQTSKSNNRLRRKVEESPCSLGEDPPPYGSQEYWEDRYKEVTSCRTAVSPNDSLPKTGDSAPLEAKATKSTTTTADTIITTTNNSPPEPFHAWYFGYDELAPLILPLIIGKKDDESDDELEEEENLDEDEDKDECQNASHESKEAPTEQNPASRSVEPDARDVQSTVVTTKQSLDAEDSRSSSREPIQIDCTNPDGIIEKDDNEIIEEEEEEGEEEDEETKDLKRKGLASDGPISILEVGCGDVPLGRDILNEVVSMEAIKGDEASNVLKKVHCVDYSKNVIDTMITKQQTDTKKLSSIELVYKVADARKLPYDDLSFELILEKGTLDAMLSDKNVGAENCRRIVSECARVMSTTSCLIVISHLNAHLQSGLDWLDNIIVPGLRKGAKEYKWQIEVHGNETDISEQPDEDSEEPENPGPAVYIIWKNGKRTDCEDGKQQEANDLPTIPLKFFTY